MAQYNNQMSVKIEKEYYWLEYIDTMKACRALNGAAFKVYVYFASYSRGETIDFSPQDVGNELGIGVSTARNAFNELIREGYLVKIGDKLFKFTGGQKL